jgi:hypothetical protein
MKKFLAGFVLGAVFALAAYIAGPLPKVEENATISGFINGAHLVLLAVDDEFTHEPNPSVALRHVQFWRGCGIASLIRESPEAYRRLQAVETAHPSSGFRAHIAAACSAADLGD